MASAALSVSGPRSAGMVGSRPRLGQSTIAIAGLVRLLSILCHAPLAYALPFVTRSFEKTEEDGPKSASDPDLWINLTVAFALVVLGGAFAGLTIALMGQEYAISITFTELTLPARSIFK